MRLFDTLLDSKQTPPGRSILRRSGASVGSIGLHASILFCLLAVSVMSPEALPEPAVKRAPIDEFIVPVSIVAAAAPSPRGSSGDRAQPEHQPAPPRDEIPDTVQPQEIAKTHPAAGPAVAGEGDEMGSDDGIPGGIPGGIKGGIPGGHPDGIIGGDPNGRPWGVLDGLPSSGEDDVPIHFGGVVSAPVRTLYVAPAYPELARKARKEGTVILQIVIGRGGDVEEIEMLKSSPLFDQAAMEAVRKWKYRPSLQDSRPVRVYLMVRVEFTLR